VRLQAQAVSRGSGRRGGARARERRVSQFPQQSCCGLLQVPLDLTHYPTVYGVVAGAGAAIAYMLSDPLRIPIHKPAIITEIVKVARTAQQQGVVNSFLETAVGALDRPVFPSEPKIVTQIIYNQSMQKSTMSLAWAYRRRL
jgi:hypothetical protein